MSLREANLGAHDFISVALKQWRYKLKGYSGFVYSLMIMQGLALLFSFNPTGKMSSSSDNLIVSLQTHSPDVLKFFSFAWIFAIGILLAMKPYKTIEFSLVANRISGNLSNFFLLVTYSVLGGLTATLMSIAQRVIIYMTQNPLQIVYEGFFISPTDWMLEFWVTCLYMVLVASIGYLLRTAFEFHPALGAILIFSGISLPRVVAQPFTLILYSFIKEASLFSFTFKVIVGSCILFGISAILSNRMEVRK